MSNLFYSLNHLNLIRNPSTLRHENPNLVVGCLLYLGCRLKIRDIDKPLLAGTNNHWFLSPPVIGIAVDHVFLFQQSLCGLKHLYNLKKKKSVTIYIRHN